MIIGYITETNIYTSFTEQKEMVLRANPEMKQVYDYAKAQGKNRYVFTNKVYCKSIKEIKKCIGEQFFNLFYYVTTNINTYKGFKKD